MRSFSSEMNLFLRPVMKEISKVYLLRVLVPLQGFCFSGFALFFNNLEAVCVCSVGGTGFKLRRRVAALCKRRNLFKKLKCSWKGAAAF